MNTRMIAPMNSRMIMTPISPGAGTFFETKNGVKKKKTGKSLTDYVEQKNSGSQYMYWDCKKAVAQRAKYICFVIRCPKKFYKQKNFSEEFKIYYEEPMMIVYEILSYNVGSSRASNGWVNEYVNSNGNIIDHSEHVTLTLKRKSLGKFKWKIWKQLRGMSEKEVQMRTFQTSEKNKINGSYFSINDERY
jgi:hypothetical protein